MDAKEPVNILLVDDQPAKLLTYETILGDLGENLIRANSGKEALEHLLKTDIAVVLVDVCMPGLDGFELATMIRQHPRFERTAVILVSGILVEDRDRLKGYDSGAVDYVSVPIIPEILRAKVAVFAELFRKSHELEQLNRELREKERETRQIIDSAHDAFVAMDETGRIVDWNPQAETLFGWTRAEALGAVLADTIIPPQHRPAHREGLARFLATGEGPVLNRRIEIEALHRDGRAFPVELTISTLPAGKGHRFNSFIHDITEQRRARERLARQATALAESNQDLEAFCYSVSHDLRAPLRHIAGFAELLQGQHAGALDAEGLRYLATITRSAQRMGQLIDDLLAFSRIGRASLCRERIELAALVQEAIAQVKEEGGDRSIDWQVGVLPAVTGDAAMLTVVLANLLSNAVKYTRTRERATIEVGCRPAEDGWVVLSVRDNGVGFDMEHADQLFGVFQRLHRADEFEGTGVGLATVRRIVERHGGRTWAEGEVGGGATFYLHLPGAAEEHVA